MDLSIYKNNYRPSEEVDYNYNVFKLLNEPKLVIEHNSKKQELRIVNGEGKLVGFIYKAYTYKLFNSIFFKLFIYDKNNELLLMIKQSFKGIITTYLPSTSDFVYFKQIGKVSINPRSYSLYTDEGFGEIEIIPGVNDFAVKSKEFALGCVETGINSYNIRFDLSGTKGYGRYKTNLDFLQRAVVLSAGILIDISGRQRRLNHEWAITK